MTAEFWMMLLFWAGVAYTCAQAFRQMNWEDRIVTFVLLCLFGLFIWAQATFQFLPHDFS